MKRTVCILFVWLLLAGAGYACQGGKQLIVASTTSLDDSGLLDVLAREFQRGFGIAVRVVAVGSGQALELGRRGDADVLLVHDPRAEEEFVASGHGIERAAVMENSFVIVGPAADPAGVAGARSAPEAFGRIAAAGRLFLSRGDNSGTHMAEKRVWQAAGITPAGSWYREVGQGMGETLTMASQMGAYTLADAATCAARRASVELAALYDCGRELPNVYSVIIVNPRLHPRVNAEGARKFAAFLTSPAGRDLISSFGRERFGAPLFRPAGDRGVVD